MEANATPAARGLRSGATTDHRSWRHNPIAARQRGRDQAADELRKRRTLELLERARDDLLPEAKRQVCIDMAVQLNLPIAEALLRRYQPRGEDLDDLIRVARLGLFQAVTRFSPDIGEFEPFAVATMAGEIKQHFRDRWRGPAPHRRIQELR